MGNGLHIHLGESSSSRESSISISGAAVQRVRNPSLPIPGGRAHSGEEDNAVHMPAARSSRRVREVQ